MTFHTKIGTSCISWNIYGWVHYDFILLTLRIVYYIVAIYNHMRVYYTLSMWRSLIHKICTNVVFNVGLIKIRSQLIMSTLLSWVHYESVRILVPGWGVNTSWGSIYSRVHCGLGYIMSQVKLPTYATETSSRASSPNTGTESKLQSRALKDTETEVGSTWNELQCSWRYGNLKKRIALSYIFRNRGFYFKEREAKICHTSMN